MLDRKFNIHFVGIGGIGMSGIAEICLLRGHAVSGSDLQASEVTEKLVRMGAQIQAGHAAKNIITPDVLVVSSAIGEDNPECVEAKRKNIPIIKRAEMLAELMRGKIGVAIAGTHGKTTTTSMISHIFMHGGLDPTVVVGGKVEALGGNAKQGEGSFMVVEADESDGSFRLLPATYGVVTNIDEDHMDFFKTRALLDDAFVSFAEKIPFYGAVYLCGDDPGVRGIVRRLNKPNFTYGFQRQNDWIASQPEVMAGGQEFDVTFKNEHILKVRLSVLGDHNALNALAAIAIAIRAGVTPVNIAQALARFHHVKRRFDLRYQDSAREIYIIDDYGHHPTEIRAVLNTAKQMTPKRVVVCFQPHRYTRTQYSFDDFIKCFDGVDSLILLPIYSAGEQPIEGITSEALMNAMKMRNPKAMVCLAIDLDHAAKLLMEQMIAGDLVLTLGAGTVTNLAKNLIDKISIGHSE